MRYLRCAWDLGFRVNPKPWDDYVVAGMACSLPHSEPGKSGVSLTTDCPLVCCLQTHPIGRVGIVAYLFIMHVLLVLCSFSSRHGPIP